MKCEDDIDECNEGEYPCADNDNTECVNSIGSHECRCKVGWKGTDCTEERLYCEEIPCKNGGECTEYQSNENGFVCSCLGTGFQGPTCETDILECDNSPCANGQCEELPGSYACKCEGTGYYGDHCEIACKEGNDGFCKNGATCQVTPSTNQTQGNVTECKCTVDFEGDLCEFPKSSKQTQDDDGFVKFAGSNMGIIIFVLIGVLILLIFVVVLLAIMHRLKRSRAKSGLYNPRSEEDKSKAFQIPVELDLQRPKEERLI